MPTTIQVSDHVKTQLDEIKKRNGHTSMDSVLRYLLMKAGEAQFGGVCEFEASGHLCRLRGLGVLCDVDEWWTCPLREKVMKARRAGA